ncbi:putative inorganic phosphate cotransporter [Schistocerca serialis cubense]|uniref:putative inorganic phosphate cotransporter n=1 Tax=Schistocerca serialis cubense TaxID=2023355 RepID=UPI00214F1411|nr:putative inorganic phosphate cotransporter [Schistocerca serialis cubense]
MDEAAARPSIAAGDSNRGTSLRGVGLGIRHLQVVLMCGGITLAFMLRVDLSVGIVVMANNTGSNPDIKDYGWNPTETSTILSSFFWGYITTQVPAGWLSGRYGAKNFLAAALFLSGALTGLTELAADLGGVVLMCALRIVIGMVQGFIYPSTNTYLAKWIPPEEKGRMGTLVYAGAQLGTIVAMAVSGVLANSAAGWPSIFYTFGGISVLWGILIFFLGADKPSSHKYISKEEQFYIEDCLNKVSHEGERMPTPWISILSSMPFIALAVVHCGQNWGFYTLLTEMPTYFSSVLGFDIQSDGLLSAMPYLVMWCLSFIFSWIGHLIERKNWMTTGTIRKVFNSIGHWGPGLALLILSFIELEDPTVAVALLTLTVGLNSGIYLGFQINHIDLSPNFSGVLMGMTNGLAALTSIIAPLIVGAVVKNNAPEEWRTIFLIAAGFYFIGNLIFIIFGKGEVQPWNEPTRLTKESEANYGTAAPPSA